METIKDILRNEPLLVRMVTAIAVLSASLGWQIGSDTLDAVVEVGSIAGVILLMFDARSKVTPTAKADAEIAAVTEKAEVAIDEAYVANPAVDAKPTL